jgi:hypothetical protein
MLKIGCTTLDGLPTRTTIGIPVTGAGIARFECKNAEGDSLTAAVQRFVEASRAGLLGAFAATSYQSVVVYLGTRLFCDQTVYKTYDDGVLVQIEIEWHENTCRWLPNYITIRIPLDNPGYVDPWLGEVGVGGGGSSGGYSPTFPRPVEFPDSVATEDLMEEFCFAARETKPGACLKRFKPEVLDSIRSTTRYLRPLSEIPDSLARAECALVRGYLSTLLATDTLLFMGDHDSPKLNADLTPQRTPGGEPIFWHYAETEYHDTDPAHFGKSHIEPYYVKLLMRAAQPPITSRAILRLLMHEAAHVVTRAKHPEVVYGTTNPVYESALFRTIESRDPNRSCIVPGTGEYVP